MFYKISRKHAVIFSCFNYQIWIRNVRIVKIKTIVKLKANTVVEVFFSFFEPNLYAHSSVCIITYIVFICVYATITFALVYEICKKILKFH